jgi:hypothetical protein
VFFVQKIYKKICGLAFENEKTIAERQKIAIYLALYNNDFFLKLCHNKIA